MAKELRHPTGRKIRSDSDYDEKYAKELASGIRYKLGLSIPQLCRKWRISRGTYTNWRKTYKDFDEAAKMAEMDYAAYRWEKLEDLIDGKIKGNAACAIFALEQADGVEYGRKVNVHNTHEEKIEKIEIKVLPRGESRIIDHDPDRLEHKDD